MKNEMDNIATLCEKAKKCLNGSSDKITVEDGEKLINSFKQFTKLPPEIEELNLEIEKTKAWETRLRNTGIEEGVADVADLKLLLAEGEDIRMDVSHYLSTLQQATQVYCLCKRSHTGFMVGCDTCDEWYGDAHTSLYIHRYL